MKNETDLIKMIAGQWLSSSIYIFVKLGLVEALDEGPKTARELADRSQASPDFLERILGALAQNDLLQVSPEQTYALTDLGACLRPGAPGGCHAWALLWGEQFARSWSHALEAVRHGSVGFELAHGCSLFGYLQQNGGAASTFNSAMRGFSQLIYGSAARLLASGATRRIVDVGGGTGELLRELLRLEPHSVGVLFDQEEVVAEASELFAGPDIADRFTLVAGDFFSDALPSGDLYILANVIHDWEEEDAVKILSNCRRAMGEHGKLALLEMLLGGEVEPELARMTDLNMMMLTGGRERTQEDMQSLLHRAGFDIAVVRPAGGTTCLIEALPRPAGGSQQAA